MFANITQKREWILCWGRKKITGKNKQTMEIGNGFLVEENQAVVDKAVRRLLEAQVRLQQSIESLSKNPDQLCRHSPQYYTGIALLCGQYDMLRSEIAEPAGEQCISLRNAEKEVARYIAECLGCYGQQSDDIEYIQSLVADYRVVVCLPGGKYSLSLDRLCRILEDNYAETSLYRMIRLFTMGSEKYEPKVITL